MRRAIAILNDANVSLISADGVLAASPGYAVLESKRLLIGNAAFAAARANPRQTVHQFWSRLSTDPLPITAPKATTWADLAYQHLLDLYAGIPESQKPEELLFVVPTSMNTEQLSLLLGIAQQFNFRTAGFVDLGVASASVGSASDNIALFEVLLQHGLLVGLQNSDGRAGTPIAHECSPLGAVSLADLWANTVRDQMIRATRFDPMHNAQTEQALYDRVTEIQQQLQVEQAFDFESEHAGKTHRVTIPASDLTAAVRPRYDQLADLLLRLDATPQHIVLGPVANQMPGLGDYLADATSATTSSVEPETIAEHVLAHWDELLPADSPVKFITAMPWGGRQIGTGASSAAFAPAVAQPSAPATLRTTVTDPAEPQASEAPAGTTSPERPRADTMLLCNNVGYGLTDRALPVGFGPNPGTGRWLSIAEVPATEPDAVKIATIVQTGDQILLVPEATGPQVICNGAAVTGPAILSAGDSIVINDVELTLIAVADHGT